MQLQIIHETRYDYVPAVETAQHMAYLQPVNNAQQRLIRHSLAVSPAPAQQTSTADVFGNMRCFFSLQSTHEQLTVHADSVVVTNSIRETPDSTVTWESVRERFRYKAGGAFDAASEFVFASPYVPRHPDFLDYARPSFGAGAPLMAAAQDLMSRIHAEFVYESQSTHVNTPALEA
ncbi:MAG: transglutaminase family protein, partial [Rhodoferax sp.]|nr:transglutaminase family protein [Rhodoferax sp.]